MRVAVFSLLSVFVVAGSQERPGADALILKLGSSDIAEREAATRALIECGESVRPALDRATSNPNKEIATRAKQILRALERHVDGLSHAFERIRKESGDSYQRMVRDSTHAAAAVFEGKDLRPMIKSLERQGFTLEKWRDETDVAQYRVIVKPGALVSAAGVTHDLVLNLTADYKPSKLEPTREIVRDAGAGLRTRQKADMADILAKPYPAKTALELAFSHDETRNGQSEFPVVEEIELSYHQFGSHREETLDWGFDVVIRCANREHSAGYLASYFFASGLDAHQERGKAENPAGFESKDTLEVRYASGSGSWTSTKGTVSRELRRSDYQEPPHWYEVFEKAPKARGGGDLGVLPAELAALTVKGTEFTSENGPTLLRFTKLSHLSWDVDPGSMAGVAFWSDLPALEFLEVSNSGIDDDFLERLSRATRIKDLTLRKCSQVTDDGVAHLTKLEGLKRLILWEGSRLTDRALEHISKLKNLESLHFSRCGKFTDAGFELLSRMPRLERLSFAFNDGFTSRGLALLARLRLKYLSFTFGNIDDAVFEVAGRIPTLEVLWLNGLKNLTDKGLGQLKGLKELRRLYIYGFPGISTEGLKALQAALPGKYVLE